MAPKRPWLDEPQQHQLAQDLYSKYVQENDTSTDFEILSTIRYDPALSKTPPKEVTEITEANFFLLKQHYERLDYTLGFFLKDKTVDISYELLLAKLIEMFKESKADLTVAYKVRSLVCLNGKITIELHETAPITNLYEGLEATFDYFDLQNKWDVYVDSQDTLISPFTSFKTTHRPHYTEARQRNLPQKSTHEEVLLWNTQETLMEGSITNVAIKSNGVWLTPELSCGCLCGVMRHHLLTKGYIKEGVISKNDLSIGDEVLLFNAIMGVVKGIIRGIPE